CAPAAAVTSGLAATLVAGGHPAERVLPLLALMALMAGALQALYGLVGLGRLMKYLPYQVVSGFLSGVAVIIAAGQLPVLLGLPRSAGLLGVLAPGLWRWQALAVGATTVAAVLLAPRVTTRVPAAVIGLAAGIAAYAGLAAGLPELRVLDGNPFVIGSLAGVPALAYVQGRVGSLLTLGPADLGLVAASAVTLSALLSLDTLKTAVVLDVLTRGRHGSNRELVAQGLANMASALLGGIPGGGTMGPTLVNATSGGRTPWSGFFEGVLALVAFVALTPLLAWIPLSALAGLLLVVAARMFDWSTLRLVGHASTRFDFVVIATVVVVAVQVGLIQASVLGTALAMLVFVREQASTPVVLARRDLTRAGSRIRRPRVARELLDAHGDDGVVVALGGSLFFGTTDRLFDELSTDLAARRFVLLDLRRVAAMDYTAGRLLGQMASQLSERGGSLLFSGMPAPGSQVAAYLEELGLVGARGSVPVFEHQDDALEWMEDRILDACGYEEDPHGPPLPFEALRPVRDLSPEAREALAGIARQVHLDAGEVVFTRKEPGQTLYLVASGAVDLELPLKAGGAHHLATISRDDVFGEMGFLEGRTRTADARARRDSVVYALERHAFDALAHRVPEVAEVVFAHLATEVSHRLRRADKELRALEGR
ncbi:MAG: SLC26A/SulP transporter family protein, partial [Myxococcales bacterium]|nr:SLC26A/SulP transporter family protein [Myxococcales bacterium]